MDSDPDASSILQRNIGRGTDFNNFIRGAHNWSSCCREFNMCYLAFLERSVLVTKVLEPPSGEHVPEEI